MIAIEVEFCQKHELQCFENNFFLSDRNLSSLLSFKSVVLISKYFEKSRAFSFVVVDDSNEKQ